MINSNPGPSLTAKQAIEAAIDAGKKLPHADALATTQVPAGEVAIGEAAPAPEAHVTQAAIEFHQALLEVRRKVGAAGVEVILEGLDAGVRAAATKALPLPVQLGETPRTAYDRVGREILAEEQAVKSLVQQIARAPQPFRTDASPGQYGATHNLSRFLDDAVEDKPLPVVKKGLIFTRGEPERKYEVDKREEAVRQAELFNAGVRAAFPDAPPSVLMRTPREPKNGLRTDADAARAINNAYRPLVEQRSRLGALHKDRLELRTAVLDRVFPPAGEVAERKARLFDATRTAAEIMPELAGEMEALVAELVSFAHTPPARSELKEVERITTDGATTENASAVSTESRVLSRDKHTVQASTATAEMKAVVSRSILETIQPSTTVKFAELRNEKPSNNVRSVLDAAIFVSRVEMLQQVYEAMQFHDPKSALTEELKKFMATKDFVLLNAANSDEHSVELSDVRPALLKLEKALDLPPRFIARVDEEHREGPPVKTPSRFGARASLNEI